MGGKAKLHADDLGLLDDAGVEGEAVYVKDEEGEDKRAFFRRLCQCVDLAMVATERV